MTQCLRLGGTHQLVKIVKFDNMPQFLKNKRLKICIVTKAHIIIYYISHEQAQDQLKFPSFFAGVFKRAPNIVNRMKPCFFPF
jgi:hypothetical protein